MQNVAWFSWFARFYLYSTRQFCRFLFSFLLFAHPLSSGVKHLAARIEHDSSLWAYWYAGLHCKVRNLLPDSASTPLTPFCMQGYIAQSGIRGFCLGHRWRPTQTFSFSPWLSNVYLPWTSKFIAGASINSYAPKSCWLGLGYWSYELYGAWALLFKSLPDGSGTSVPLELSGRLSTSFRPKM